MHILRTLVLDIHRQALVCHMGLCSSILIYIFFLPEALYPISSKLGHQWKTRRKVCREGRHVWGDEQLRSAGPLTSVEEGMSLHKHIGVLDFVCKRLWYCESVSCPTCVEGLSCTEREEGRGGWEVVALHATSHSEGAQGHYLPQSG